MNSTRPRPHDDGGLANAVFLIPLFAGLAIAVLLVGSLSGWNPLWPKNAATLSEVVALRDTAGALALISEGHDPNGTYDVREELLTSHALRITPLQAAVSTRETYVVKMLLDNGARLDETTGPVLICLAQKVGAPEVEKMLAGLVAAPNDCSTVTLPW